MSQQFSQLQINNSFRKYKYGHSDEQSCLYVETCNKGIGKITCPEILLYQGEKKNPRRLTPRECARLMGFPDSFQIPVSDTRAYKQFGNSVVVPVMQAVAKAMEPMLK